MTEDETITKQTFSLFFRLFNLKLAEVKDDVFVELLILATIQRLCCTLISFCLFVLHQIPQLVSLNTL